jgi:LssY C-terminus
LQTVWCNSGKVTRLLLSRIAGARYQSVGRKEDLAFEKPVGSSPKERHHVRFWRMAKTDGDRPAWIASAAYDIGVELSRTTGQVTHHISPNLEVISSQLTRARERAISDKFGHNNCAILRNSCEARKSVGRDNAQSTAQLRQNCAIMRSGQMGSTPVRAADFPSFVPRGSADYSSLFFFGCCT